MPPRRKSFTTKIGGRTFRVKYEDLSEDGEFGCSSYNDKYIHLDNKLDSEDHQETFIHEVLHMVAIAVGEQDEWPEERVQKWGNALAQALEPMMRRSAKR